MTVEEKLCFVWITKNGDHDGNVLSSAELARRHNLHPNTCASWCTAIDEGKSPRGKRGRPKKCDDIGYQEYKKAIKRRKDERNAISIQEGKELFQQKVEETAARDNKAFSGASAATFYRLNKEMGVVKRTPQKESISRFKACKDVRMSYTQWIMLKALTSNLPPHVIWNWDATQFVYNASNSDQVLVLVDSRDKKLITSRGDDKLSIVIKWMHMGSANGEVVPLTLIVAIDEMKGNDFHVVQVPAMSYKREHGSCGYLAFCPTRAANPAFFNWFVEDLAIPTINESREHHLGQQVSHFN